MAAQKTSEEAEGSSKIINNVMKSKRRRFQDEDIQEPSQVDCHLKELLAKELSEYLDRTFEEVEICEKSLSSNMEEIDDFQLFSSYQQKASITLAEEKQNCLHKDTKATCYSSSSEDDDETKARLKEAAVSVQDIFGSKFNHDTKTGNNYSHIKLIK